MEFEKVVSYALSYINSLVGGWPIDAWISVGRDWDLNLFYNYKTGRNCATLYPVVDGIIQTGEDGVYILIS